MISTLSDFQNYAQSHGLCGLDFKCFERNHIYETVALRLVFKNSKEYCEIPSQGSPQQLHESSWAFLLKLFRHASPETSLPEARPVPFAGTQSIHCKGGKGTCFHTAFSKPLCLKGEFSSTGEMAGQYSNAPKHTDSSFIQQ